MGYNKEISIKRRLDIGQDAELPRTKVSKNNFSDTIKDGTAISINTSSNKANELGSYKSSKALQQSIPRKVDKEQSMVDNKPYGETLANSERTITLKDNLKGELGIDKTIPQYTNYIKEWLNGCLSYRFVGERIGKQISADDQMLEDPVIPVILSVEAVMFLIENDIPLGCLDNNTLNNLSKDQLIIDLIGRICNNLELSEGKIDDVATECCKCYDNIEFEIG